MSLTALRQQDKGESRHKHGNGERETTSTCL
jgi:hypothetical protein